MASADMLLAEQVGVTFKGLRALHEVNLQVRPGEVVGLIGPNGAGKTTMVNVLTGFLPPSAGHIRLGGQLLNGRRAHEFRRLGIARTFQAGRLFRNMSVQDNLVVSGTALGASLQDANHQARQLIAELQIQPIAQHMAGSVPYTDERRVAIARALMGAPKFLLLDEPAAGMSDHEATELAALILELARERGCGVLLIEHNVRMVLETCSQIVVLDSGEPIAQGSPEVIRNDERVRAAYMGTAADAPANTEAALG
jgi:branched-chain amino acid transport system ATP-binding protein